MEQQQDKTFLEIDTREQMNEIAIKAIERLDALKDFFFFAKQEDELEVNLSDATRLIFLTDNTAKRITEELEKLLADNGVHTRRI